MARQFLIGELGSTSYTSGKLADTGLDIQVLNASNDEGPLSYAMGDPVPDMVRIVQGTTSGPNVYSNWFNPRNVIVFDGSSYEAPTGSYCQINSSDASVVAAGANGDLELKFVKKAGVAGPEEFWHLSVDLSAGADATGGAAGDNDYVVKTAYDNATKPDWLFEKCILNGGSVGTDSPAAANGGAVASANTRVRFYGQIPGSTSTSSGGTYEGDASQISVIVVTQNDITTATWSAATTTLDTDFGKGDNGVGAYYSVNKKENEMKGIMYGYYNRRDLPNTPDNGAVSGSTYDMITIVATKDGSAMSGQIHGVDNLDEIFIAGKVDVATISGAGGLVSKLNGVFSHMPSIAV